MSAEQPTPAVDWENPLAFQEWSTDAIASVLTAVARARLFGLWDRCTDRPDWDESHGDFMAQATAIAHVAAIEALAGFESALAAISLSPET